MSDVLMLVIVPPSERLANSTGPGDGGSPGTLLSSCATQIAVGSPSGATARFTQLARGHFRRNSVPALVALIREGCRVTSTIPPCSMPQKRACFITRSFSAGSGSAELDHGGDYPSRDVLNCGNGPERIWP